MTVMIELIILLVLSAKAAKVASHLLLLVSFILNSLYFAVFLNCLLLLFMSLYIIQRLAYT